MDLKVFRNKIVGWYEKNRRLLPWRLKPTPYRVWISEIMLQQTQSKTVIPYYDRFLKRFPDITSLARASEEEVLALWSGLGYYSRARNILKAARLIVQFHDGIFPKDYRTILSLPGIGRYTAGAICSIALNQPQPVVDGNIRRVIARFRGVREKVPDKYFWNQMTAWIPENKASSFNQAVMELGATICLPTQPLCPKCPLKRLCFARKNNLQSSIPLSDPPKAVRHLQLVILILKHRGRSLLTFQENSFIPGEWGFPYVKTPPKLSPSRAAARLCRDLIGREIPLNYTAAIRHSITHRRILAHVFTGKTGGKVSKVQNWKGKTYWATDLQLSEKLTSSLYRKALQSCRKKQ